VPEEVQVERLMQRDGVTREAAIQSIRAQMKTEEKARRAHVVLDNTGPLDHLQHQIDSLAL
jgi:dephospho-CoA kinase